MATKLGDLGQELSWKQSQGSFGDDIKTSGKYQCWSRIIRPGKPYERGGTEFRLIFHEVSLKKRR